MEAKTRSIILTVVVLISIFIVIVFKIKSDRKRKSLIVSSSDRDKDITVVENNPQGDKVFTTRRTEDQLYARNMMFILVICLIGIILLGVVIDGFISDSFGNGGIYLSGALAFYIFIILLFVVSYIRLQKIKGSYVVFDNDSLAFKSRQVEKKFKTLAEIKAIIIKTNTIDIYDLNRNKFTIYLDDYNYNQFQFVDGKDKKEIKAIFLKLKTYIHTGAISIAGQRQDNYFNNEQPAPKPETKKGFFAGSKSWALAVVTLFTAFIPLSVFMDHHAQIRELDYTGIIALIIYCLIITVSCFLTVKHHPKSIWYVPLICNILTIIIAIGISKYSWATQLFKLLVGVFVLSIIASIFGAIFGKMTIVPDNHQNTTE